MCVCPSPCRIRLSISAVAATYGVLAQLPLLEQEAELQFPELGPNVFPCVNTPTLQNHLFIRAVKQEM